MNEIVSNDSKQQQDALLDMDYYLWLTEEEKKLFEQFARSSEAIVDPVLMRSRDDYGC